ncbi:hypothetical protein AAT19DRAFT_11519 [Rhodotorula toruloides]|uniref:Uncharacterized protein n=1 Tax=Rhodotorula toruloides TaxID=5286 RepID=A0A2S9ZX04_RHOTO|nr:hypothetical protein AAT19DRAFT_11519 [Rhodotorula toruloides]
MADQAGRACVSISRSSSRTAGGSRRAGSRNDEGRAAGLHRQTSPLASLPEHARAPRSSPSHPLVLDFPPPPVLDSTTPLERDGSLQHSFLHLARGCSSGCRWSRRKSRARFGRKSREGATETAQRKIHRHLCLDHGGAPRLPHPPQPHPHRRTLLRPSTPQTGCPEREGPAERLRRLQRQACGLALVGQGRLARPQAGARSSDRVDLPSPRPRYGHRHRQHRLLRRRLDATSLGSECWIFHCSGFLPPLRPHRHRQLSDPLHVRRKEQRDRETDRCVVATRFLRIADEAPGGRIPSCAFLTSQACRTNPFASTTFSSASSRLSSPSCTPLPTSRTARTSWRTRRPKSTSSGASSPSSSCLSTASLA